MKNFKEVLTEGKKEYKLRIKTLFPITDELYSKLENYLKKYDIIEISKVKRTVPQINPIDFFDVMHGEVYIIDVILGLPVSSYYILQDLKVALSCNEKYLVVRSFAEHQEYETEKMEAELELDSEAKEKGLIPASKLSTDSAYPKDDTVIDGDIIAGNEYNERFKQYLANVMKNRVLPNEPVEQEKLGLFNWLKDRPSFEDSKDFNPDQNVDFNKDIKDAPKVYTKADGKDMDDQPKEEKLYNEITSQDDNISNLRTYYKSYINPNTGERIELSKTFLKDKK